MSKKKTKNPFQSLLECVGTAVVAVALVPLTIVEGIISS